MKKTLLKILATVTFFVAQYHIRQYYGIDPRIWFFVVFIGLIIILKVFYSEIKSMEEYFKTYSFFEFVSEISKKVKHMTEKISAKIKPITEKVVNSFIYSLLSDITSMVAFTGMMYKLFFREDFMARTTLNIVFFVIIAWTALSIIIRATVIEEEKRIKEFAYGGVWVYAFLTHFVEFVCI